MNELERSLEQLQLDIDYVRRLMAELALALAQNLAALQRAEERSRGAGDQGAT